MTPNERTACEYQSHARDGYNAAQQALADKNVLKWELERSWARNCARVARVWRAGTFAVEDEENQPLAPSTGSADKP